MLTSLFEEAITAVEEEIADWPEGYAPLADDIQEWLAKTKDLLAKLSTTDADTEDYHYADD